MLFPLELSNKAPAGKYESTNKAYEKRKNAGIYADHCPGTVDETRKAIIWGKARKIIAPEQLSGLGKQLILSKRR